jgi:4-amino-4-deoxy-L-arabinose transferase-like glycosyltransferase
VRRPWPAADRLPRLASARVATSGPVAAPTRASVLTSLSAERFVWLALIALLVVRIGLSLHMIDRPGLDMDETIFVNAASLRLPGVYITHSFHGIPLMIFPYTGALKSWLYDPIFAVLGTSTTKIRLPAVLIASAGLLLLYPALRDLVNRSVAALAVVALCFDNSIFWLTRDDVGPSAISLFLECAAVFCVARLAGTRRLRWVVLLLAVLGLGVFNKLNFIWIVNAAAAVSVVIVVRQRRSLRKDWRMLATWAIGLAILYACFGLYYFTNHIGSIDARTFQGSLLGYTWPQFSAGTAAIISGTWFYDYALKSLSPNYVVVWVVLALFALGLLASITYRRTRNLAIAGFGLATIVIAVQNLITPQATAGWHYISIYPFITIVASYGVYAAARSLLRSDVQVAGTMGVIAISALVYDGALMGRYFDALNREPKFSAWSPAIYQLSNELNHLSGTVFTADWGIFNPLFALDPSSRYRELGYALGDGTPAALGTASAELTSTPGPKLVVTHVTDKLVFPDANSNLVKIAGGHLRLISSIDGLDGMPVYDLYSYR